MRRLFVITACILATSCATRQSYRPLPDRYTTLPASAAESFLFYAVPAFGEPTARRFDFTEDGGIVRVEIRTFGLAGPGAVTRKEGAEASRLRGCFRGFDWNAVEPPQNGVVMFTDDVALVLKARTRRSYREAHAGMAECEAMGNLFRAVTE
jgi:hypothetical protein